MRKSQEMTALPMHCRQLQQQQTQQALQTKLSQCPGTPERLSKLKRPEHCGGSLLPRPLARLRLQRTRRRADPSCRSLPLRRRPRLHPRHQLPHLASEKLILLRLQTRRLGRQRRAPRWRTGRSLTAPRQTPPRILSFEHPRQRWKQQRASLRVRWLQPARCCLLASCRRVLQSTAATLHQGQRSACAMT